MCKHRQPREVKPKANHIMITVWTQHINFINIHPDLSLFGIEWLYSIPWMNIKVLFPHPPPCLPLLEFGKIPEAGSGQKQIVWNNVNVFTSFPSGWWSWEPRGPSARVGGQLPSSLSSTSWNRKLGFMLKAFQSVIQPSKLCWERGLLAVNPWADNPCHPFAVEHYSQDTL